MLLFDTVSVSVHDSNRFFQMLYDIHIDLYFFFFRDNEHVVFCQINGELSVHCVNFNQSTRFLHVFSIEMPLNFELNAPRLLFNRTTSVLFVYNSHGSILRYKWKTINETTTQEAYIYLPCQINHQYCDENFDANVPSLEQQKQFHVENVRKVQMQHRKTEMLEIIARLKNQFIEIKDRNSKLPEKYQLDDAVFEIDKRVTNDLEQRKQQKFKAIQSELQRKIDKIRHQAERMEHLYLDNLEHWPIMLTGFRLVSKRNKDKYSIHLDTFVLYFRNQTFVETFLIYEINDEFQALKVQFDAREATFELTTSRYKHSMILSKNE